MRRSAPRQDLRVRLSKTVWTEMGGCVAVPWSHRPDMAATFLRLSNSICDDAVILVVPHGRRRVR